MWIQCSNPRRWLFCMDVKNSIDEENKKIDEENKKIDEYNRKVDKYNEELDNGENPKDDF